MARWVRRLMSAYAIESALPSSAVHWRRTLVCPRVALWRRTSRLPETQQDPVPGVEDRLRHRSRTAHRRLCRCEACGRRAQRIARPGSARRRSYTRATWPAIFAGRVQSTMSGGSRSWTKRRYSPMCWISAPRERECTLPACSRRPCQRGWMIARWPRNAPAGGRGDHFPSTALRIAADWFLDSRGPPGLLRARVWRLCGARLRHNAAAVVGREPNFS